MVSKAKESRSASQECALCGQKREHGSLLRPEGASEVDALWVCDDCQHKLSRRVDDEDVKGG